LDKPESPINNNPATVATSENTNSEEINAQTGVLEWTELAKYFARGVVIKVDPGLDLVEVAHSMSEDNTTQIQQWLTAGSISRASDEDAKNWNRDNQQFWSVVAAPWVLVQEKG